MARRPRYFPWFDMGKLGRSVPQMSDQSRISATVSATTKERLDRFTESHGLETNYVVEQALLYFMDARRELRNEALVPTRLVLEDEAFDPLVDALAKPAPPNLALQELMRGPKR